MCFTSTNQVKSVEQEEEGFVVEVGEVGVVEAEAEEEEVCVVVVVVV
jgi:hypothetical protein